MYKGIMAGVGLACLVMSGHAAYAEGRPAAGKLAEVQKRGALRCPAHTGSQLGFAQVDGTGNWTGFDIDMCRVFATAIFGTYEGHLDLIPISWAQRWPALQSGELDVVIKQSGWTQSRDTELGFNASRPYIIGTFQVMTHKELGAAHITDLDGGSICAPAGSTNERVIAEYAAAKGISLETVSYEKWEELLSAYFEGRCDGIIGTASTLAVSRMNAKTPDDQLILPDVVSLEAQVWYVKEGDDQWEDIANWALNALWFAEQEGITSKNVDEIRANPPSAAIATMLGTTPGVGKRLGLPDDWAYNVIKVNGNYSEIWERDLGMESAFRLERGINALWKDGGVHYPVAFD
ncbi:transporter substrate-binding domain-containing protein [Tistrella mobilis]|uniref:General L-amino acid transport system substrate-binding protein n=1 Tax=Tistrella mobilis (strain KA081020-065) TaxID=1110502 RepID=I3TUN6_TISMK|nr:transporter substrate-binding domain-containing protein [Tistrella mobilis]AFK56474.1 general L-amino acid transport system substrate-binding protein [Tistrella mobilis KA081020-065]MAM74843.1 ABC transporter substrate-binding protein [Tistrella sp.]